MLTPSRAVAGANRDSMIWGQGVGARPVMVGRVTGQYFALLGVQPHLGRLFGESEDRLPAGEPVVVLDHGRRAALRAD